MQSITFDDYLNQVKQNINERFLSIDLSSETDSLHDTTIRFIIEFVQLNNSVVSNFPDQDSLIKALVYEIVGYGVFTPYIEDPDVSELMVYLPNKIHYRRRTTDSPNPLITADFPSLDPEKFESVIAKLLGEFRLTTENPIQVVNNIDFVVTVIHPSVTKTGDYALKIVKS